MSQSVVFAVGIVVFALTVWGSVMAGGIWLGRLGEAEDDRALELLRRALPLDEPEATPNSM